MLLSTGKLDGKWKHSAEFSSVAAEACLLCQELVLVRGVRFHHLACSFTNHQLQNQDDFHHEAEDAYLCLTKSLTDF